MNKTNEITVTSLQEEHLSDVVRLRNSFLNSKHALCCIPLGWGETVTTLRKSFQKHPDVMKLFAVALMDGEVMGFIQLILEGMPCDLHKVKPGEAYISMLAVDPAAQGMGCGSKLLLWAEEVGRRRGCKFMSLDVLAGNKARELYERKGYIIKSQSCGCNIVECLFLTSLFGLVICPAGSPPYVSYGRSYHMEKPLKLDGSDTFKN
mmetsp:Transcript_12769/g.15645  ORF Transcript_12769/g.15645 Transcript_12769/m.15645 type:complete len:206 (-) Transcript_12769:65-682(-)